LASADLSILEVIDRLEVGEPRVEPNRVVTPYTVVQGKRRDSTELCYRFEEEVFDPQDPSDVNLASMMTAQVAINYGMFCRKIVLRGLFDEVDKRFITEMMRNTAREIYVHKFLHPNPFLTGAAANLEPIKLDTYVRAQVTFPVQAELARTRGAPARPSDWHTRPCGHAVLSSGGKDSLLSFGLLNELGRETHPIFVNESGRHWFTALNAYRHFKEAYPSTARVWTDADRLFSWMLRHLPFVRSDFARRRSDEYPIRLWTVAVFLFGALPLLKRRGIGRLLIGDEYDTTQTLSYKGIKHYNALFDQSRLFDRVLSRYFRSKHWGVAQFSMLRPLSELLVEKVLDERYPELLAVQMSCHATHEENGRILPCGKCENAAALSPC
jgi:hypothetical protein